ncbi:hypothetical protein QN277_003921 [Acacia crassicarpa]|uniref:Uncharacterized protein n=1 Tax=Acacia crassicarpa TaxID=499986 RepID=A0AAE1MBB6_9FABA|nr:hypothetical protein QN277_003921 [Acacia crassicarpa]
MEPSSTTKKGPIDEDGTPEIRSDTKSRPRSQKPTADDEQQEKEIEEFFAIVSRLHEALQYFRKPVSSSWTAATASAVWKPTFQLQDFQDLPDANNGLDLNSDPTLKHHPPA